MFAQLAPPLVGPHGLAPPPREGAAVSETVPIQAQLQVIKAQHDLAKAVKADDPSVPIHWWNDQVCRRSASSSDAQALGVIRELVLNYYR